MREITMIGLDIAKHVFQLHGEMPMGSRCDGGKCGCSSKSLPLVGLAGKPA